MPRGRTHHGRTAWVGYLFLAPYLLLFGAFILFPLAYSFGLSIHRWELASVAPPRFIGAGNYREALASEYFRKATWATLRFVVMAVPLTLGIGLLVALGLNAIPDRRQAFYRSAYFIPTMITVTVAGILWRWFYNSEFGIFNALLEPLGVQVGWIIDPGVAMKSIVVMSLWWGIGTPVVILLAGLQGISRSYYEAAMIDGATSRQRLVHITLPLLRRVLLFVVVINIIASFQVFGQTFIITRGGPELSTRVLVQYIYEIAFAQYRMGYGAAVSWLLFLLITACASIPFLALRER